MPTDTSMFGVGRCPGSGQPCLHSPSLTAFPQTPPQRATGQDACQHANVDGISNRRGAVFAAPADRRVPIHEFSFGDRLMYAYDALVGARSGPVGRTSIWVDRQTMEDISPLGLHMAARPAQ